MKFDLNTIKENPSNPRKISNEKFAKLKTQIKDMPETLKFRPIVINKDNVIVAGNMRHRALLELEMDKVPSEWVAKADDLTDEQVRKFIIIDNIGYGEHDWEMLQAEWDFDELEDWGLDVPSFAHDEVDYSDKNKEIDIDEFDDKMILKLEFTEDEYHLVKDKLLHLASTPEQAIFKLLGLTENE